MVPRRPRLPPRIQSKVLARAQPPRKDQLAGHRHHSLSQKDQSLVQTHQPTHATYATWCCTLHENTASTSLPGNIAWLQDYKLRFHHLGTSGSALHHHSHGGLDGRHHPTCGLLHGTSGREALHHANVPPSLSLTRWPGTSFLVHPGQVGPLSPA